MVLDDNYKSISESRSTNRNALYRALFGDVIRRRHGAGRKLASVVEIGDEGTIEQLLVDKV